MMKKLTSLVLVAVLALSLVACGKTTITLDQTELVLDAAGETALLTAETKADKLTWTSSDESVATVDANGTVTAVAPGTATITVTVDEKTSATCTVKCEWEVVIDLAAFYEELYAELYPLDSEGYSTGPFVEDFAVVPEMVEGFYPGLTAIGTKQMHIYIPAMSGVPYELVLIQVENAADVDAVKAILQARIDTESANQMNYPAVIENWELNSRIVSNGNYILMAVSEDCEAYVDAFNALF